MIRRIAGLLAPLAGTIEAVLGAGRSAAADCVSAQAGRAVARVGCDDDDTVVAGHLGGNMVTIKDDGPDHPAAFPVPHKPIPVEHAPVKPAKPAPEKPPKEKPADDREPLDGRPDRGDGAGRGDGTGRGDEDVTVDLDCESEPETITVTNDSADAITIDAVDPLRGRAIERDDVIEPGESVTYEAGQDAAGRFALGEEELFPDDDEEAGVRISTSGGEIDALCFAS